MKTHSQNYKVRENECDDKYLCRLGALWDIMQDTAGEHSEILGFGHESMQKTGCFFALMRMQCEVLRYPKFEENIKVETTAGGSEKIYVMRNYKVFDSENNLIAKADSAWVVVAMPSMRIVRPEQAYPDFFTTKVNGQLPDKITMQELAEVRNIRAEFCDIDANAHVNNSRYINWLENELNGKKISLVNANYNSEVKIHDELDVLLSENQFALKNSSEKISFIAEFKTFA